MVWIVVFELDFICIKNACKQPFLFDDMDDRT